MPARLIAPLALVALSGCVALAACGGAEPAAAADRSREFTVPAPLAGPALAGDDVIVAYPGRGGRFAVRAIRPGRRRTLVQFSRLVNQGSPGDRELTVDASSSGVAVGFSLNGGVDRPEVALGQLQVAPLSGAATTLARCSDRGFGARQVAVTGSVVGIVDLGCRRGTYARVGFDRRGAARRFSFGANELRVAGRYVAAQRASTIRVYDRTSGGETFRVTTGGPGRSFDIAADGTLAVVDGAGGSCTVRVFSTSDRTGRPLPAESACGPIRLAGGRALFVRRSGADREQLVATDLEGGDVRIVSPPLLSGALANTAPRGALSMPEDGFDFDGKRFAYFAPGCVNPRLVVGPLPAAGAPEPAVGDCPLTLSGGDLAVDASGSFTPPVSCPRGCLAAATVRREDGSIIDLRDFTVELPGSSKAGPRLRLVSENLARLRRDGRTPVTLELVQELRDGSQRTLSAKTTLVPPP